MLPEKGVELGGSVLQAQHTQRHPLQPSAHSQGWQH